MSFLKNLFAGQEICRKKVWIDTAKSNGSNFLLIGYDSLSRTNFPMYDRLSRNWLEAYKNNVRPLNSPEFIVDIIQTKEEEKEEE